MGGCMSHNDEELSDGFGKGTQIHSVSGANQFNQGLFQIEVDKNDKYAVKEILYLLLMGKYQAYQKEQEIYEKMMEKDQSNQGV